MRRTVPILLACLLLPACGPTATTSRPTTPTTREKLMEPCHPGCFPSGTLVVTPTGLREVQTIKTGDVVTLVGTDGTTTSGPVESVFQTCNKLIEVRTDAGTLTTTETQPLCLTAGGFREAGKLTAGDTIWRWENVGRKAVTVKDVTGPVREADVFNLVVGTDKVFVANGFLARGKPAEAP